MHSKRMIVSASLLPVALVWMAGCGNSGGSRLADSGTGDASHSAADSSTSEGGAFPECMGSLYESGCAATYDRARAGVSCSETSSAWVGIRQCGGLHLFTTTVIDVATTCIYDATGALVGSSECSKPVGNCNCFVAGETIPDSCQAATVTDPCASDAGA